MIWASTRDGYVTYVGPEWTIFTGQPTHEALGRGWLDMLHPEDRDKTDVFFKNACATTAAFTVVYRLRRADEGYVLVMAGAIPSISPVDHTFIGYLGTVNEIDDRPGGHENILGKAFVAPAKGSTKPQADVDVIADYLTLARATAHGAGEERLLASIDFAISEVMRRLGYRAGGGMH